MIAVAWMIFSIIILVFPSSPDPTAPDMNYTVVVLGGWILLCLVYYYFPVYGGIHWFRGPVANIDKGGDTKLPVDADSIGDVKQY